MNGMEKIEAAFSKEGTPEIPVVMPYTHIFIRDHWEELTQQPWYSIFSPDINEQIKWIKEATLSIGQDWFNLPVGYNKKEAEYFSIIKEGEKISILDSRDGSKKFFFRPRIRGESETMGRGLGQDKIPYSIEEFDQWFEIFEKNKPELVLQWFEMAKNFNIVKESAWFDKNDDEKESLFKDNFLLPQLILKDWGNAFFPLGRIVGPLWYSFNVWGFDETMTLLIDNSELVHYACKKFTEHAFKIIDISSIIGTKGIWIEDLLTEMISPEHFKTFNLNYLQEITSEIRSKKMYSIHYFCGNPYKKWELLKNTGADGLALEESKKGFTTDIEEVSAIINKKMAILGNLDPVSIVEKGSSQDLRSEIVKQMRAARKNNGKFIMSTGSPITPDTPLSRIHEYIEISRSLGKI